MKRAMILRAQLLFGGDFLHGFVSYTFVSKFGIVSLEHVHKQLSLLNPLPGSFGYDVRYIDSQGTSVIFCWRRGVA